MPSHIQNDFRNRCPLRDNAACSENVLPNWEFMRGAMPRGIMPTDIDGFVKINGCFLFIEHKTGSSPDFSAGQGLAHKRLSFQPRTTVLYLSEYYGTPDYSDPPMFNIWALEGGEVYSQEKLTTDDVWLWLGRWAERANTR